MSTQNIKSTSSGEGQSANNSSANNTTGTFGINIPEINIRSVLRSIIEALQVIVEKLADLFSYCLRMIVQSEYFVIF